MSVRDIIKAATPGPWRAKGRKGIEADGAFYGAPARRDIVSCLSPNPGYACDSQKRWSAVAEANRDFIATFDPEHQSLIEAVIEAVTPTRKHYSGEVMGMGGYEIGYTGTECPVCGSVDYGLGTQHKDDCPLPALLDYRRERGLL